jgi:hypothetical protein
MQSLSTWRHVAQTGVWVTIRGVLHLQVLFVLSLLVYWAIYRAVVPDAELSYPLYFGLCETGAAAIGAGSGSPVVSGGRVASVLLSSSVAQVPASSWARDAPSPALAAGYSYTASVCLELPESPSNVDAGTFLTELTLLGSEPSAAYDSSALLPQQPLFTSARPFVLRYRSEQLRYLSNIVFLLPLVFGIMEEKQTHCAPLADSFHNRRDQPVRLLARGRAYRGMNGKVEYLRGGWAMLVLRWGKGAMLCVYGEGGRGSARPAQRSHAARRTAAAIMSPRTSDLCYPVRSIGHLQPLA